MKEGTPLRVGDVVQIDPTGKQGEGFFAGCFMLVTEPKAFGAQGFISVPGARGTLPGRAFARIPWADMELVGHATWIPADDAEASE